MMLDIPNWQLLISSNIISRNVRNEGIRCVRGVFFRGVRSEKSLLLKETQA